MASNKVVNLTDFKKEKELATEKRLRGDHIRELLRRRITGEVNSDRRQDNRVKFAMGRHPVLILEGVPFRVLDISRTGVKFVGANLPNVGVSKIVSARLLFQGKRDLSVRAKVVRIVGDLIALHFDEPLNPPDLAGAV